MVLVFLVYKDFEFGFLVYKGFESGFFCSCVSSVYVVVSCIWLCLYVRKVGSFLYFGMWLSKVFCLCIFLIECLED